MIQEINFSDFEKRNIPLIDVRSPGEFMKGHIPGAVNIPLFTDSERAQVGTLYTRVSREKAMEAGLRFVNPKLKDFLAGARQAASDGKIAVHCWRGGMRSHSFAGFLQEHGFPEVYTLTGGYKSYRNYILSFFSIPFKLKIVGGYTGSGKTKIINFLKESGQQIIDLEGIAHHKGSSFGALGEDSQPSVEQFENNLYEAFRKLDISQPVWMEDESHNIGGVNIPMNLFTQMCGSPVFFLEIPREERAKNLVGEYSCYDPVLLSEAIRRISRRLGGQNTQTALQYLEERKFFEMTLLVLTYYDKAYLKGLRLHQPELVCRVARHSVDTVENAKAILTKYEKLPGN